MATTFNLPSSPTVGQTETLPSGALVRWNGFEWVNVGSLPADAPFDSAQYTRRNGIWVPNTVAASQITDSTSVGRAVLTATDDVAVRAATNSAKNLSYGFRNKVINGEMQVAQFNNTNTYTVNGSPYIIDQWRFYANSSNPINVTATFSGSSGIVGIPNYLRMTANIAHTLVTTGYFLFGQGFEGVTYSELGWGTAAAQPAVLTFYVRSSVPGTYAVALRDYNQSYSFVAPVVISAANTWTPITVNVPAITTGNFQLNSVVMGGDLLFNVGCGPAPQAPTANAWIAGNYYGLPGQANAMGTNGATFDLAGVQLEPGTVATPFEHHAYPLELNMCQRYWQSDISDGRPLLVIRHTTSGAFGGTQPFFRQYNVRMRTVPVVSIYSSLGRANIGNELVNNTTPSNSFVSNIYSGANSIHNASALAEVGDYFYAWGDYNAQM